MPFEADKGHDTFDSLQFIGKKGHKLKEEKGRHNKLLNRISLSYGGCCRRLLEVWFFDMCASFSVLVVGYYAACVLQSNKQLKFVVYFAQKKTIGLLFAHEEGKQKRQ